MSWSGLDGGDSMLQSVFAATMPENSAKAALIDGACHSLCDEANKNLVSFGTSHGKTVTTTTRLPALTQAVNTCFRPGRLGHLFRPRDWFETTIQVAKGNECVTIAHTD